MPMFNVDALMTQIVQASTHEAALEVAMGFPTAALRDLLDLCHATPDEQSPRKVTLALRVVVEGRGLDQGEADELCKGSGRRRPVLVG